MKLSYLKSDVESHRFLQKIENAVSIFRSSAFKTSNDSLFIKFDFNNERAFCSIHTTNPKNSLTLELKDENLRLFMTGNATLDTVNSMLTDEFIEEYNNLFCGEV